jgi:glutathione peroxidase
MSKKIYSIPCKTIDGKETTLADHEGKVMLIVNTASKCGLTPQYKGLEELHQKYSEQGLVILGFPCNQFLSQEPGDESAISEFCQINYGVSFPMFAKVDVNGDDTHPLFQHLKNEAKGLLGSETVKWNFTKFLVNRDGDVLKRFAPKTEPVKLTQDIEKLL